MKPRILMVSSRRLTNPPTAGFGIRIINTARYLAQHFTVDLLYQDRGDAECSGLEGIFDRTVPFRFPSVRYALNGLRGVASSAPMQVHLFTFPEIRSWLVDHQHAYQAIVGCHVRVAELLRDLDVPVAIDLVDAISLNYERALGQARGLRKAIYGIERERLLRYEVETVNRYARSFVVSDVDRQHLLDHGADPMRLVTTPVGVQEHVITRPAYTGPEEDAIAFLGKMNYHPNTDAALFIADHILPRLRERVPGCKFYIVGTEPSKEILALAERPGIEVTGYVRDPYQYLERAKVIVAPIRFGAGLQNKVLEGMALRKPVVATTIATKAIGGLDGREYLVADEPDAIVSALGRCFENPRLRSALGQNARAWIEAHFTWASTGRKFLQELPAIG